MSNHWAPAKVLSTGIAGGLTLFLLTLYFATGVPRLGIGSEPGLEGARVTSVDPDGPFAGILQPGDELIALRGRANAITLEPFDAVGEPDDAATYGPYNRFFERQDQLWATLQSDRVSFGFKAAETIPAPEGAPPEPATMTYPQTSIIIGTATAVTRIDMGKPRRQ